MTNLYPRIDLDFHFQIKLDLDLQRRILLANLRWSVLDARLMDWHNSPLRICLRQAVVISLICRKSGLVLVVLRLSLRHAEL